jgi:hypothetical protein
MSYMQNNKQVSPQGVTEECTEVYIDAPATLRLSDCINCTGKYTLQFYIKSNIQNYVDLESDDFKAVVMTGTDWTKYIYTFEVSEAVDGAIRFSFQPGIYHLYHVKLEQGDIATDWTPAPENVSLASDDSINDTRLFRLTDKYTDKLSCNNNTWYIERNTQLITLTGEETSWQQDSDKYIYVVEIRENDSEILPALCSHFTYAKNYESMIENQFTVINSNKDTCICFKTDNSIASLNDFKTWLKSHNVSILLPSCQNILQLPNYLQTVLNNIVTDKELKIYFNENVHKIAAAILIKPLEFGTVNSDMSVLINNESDDEIGIVCEITCKGEVINPVLYHQESNKHIKIKGNFKLNDVITIDTRRGRKTAIKTYKGVTSNIINSIDNSSKWIQLQPGANHIIQAADVGADIMETIITYTSEYEGV